jgi:hypothetical protein
MINECGVVGRMRIGRGNRSTLRKPVVVLVCSPQMTLDLTCGPTCTAVVPVYIKWLMNLVRFTDVRPAKFVFSGISLTCFYHLRLHLKDLNQALEQERSEKRKAVSSRAGGALSTPVRLL